MLFMVIEHFKDGNPHPIGERFAREGRMLPDSVEYLASWIDPEAVRCYQLMEAPDAEALQPWIARWADLADFEVVPVLASVEYWARVRA
jgi:hypothetical protein